MTHELKFAVMCLSVVLAVASCSDERGAGARSQAVGPQAGTVFRPRSLTTGGSPPAVACFDAMAETLAKDPRYVSERTYPDVERHAILDVYDRLQGNAEACVNRQLDAHEQAARDACRQRRCGDGVAGGCAHLVRDSVTLASIEVALKKCGAR